MYTQFISGCVQIDQLFHSFSSSTTLQWRTHRRAIEHVPYARLASSLMGSHRTAFNFRHSKALDCSIVRWRHLSRCSFCTDIKAFIVQSISMCERITNDEKEIGRPRSVTEIEEKERRCNNHINDESRREWDNHNYTKTILTVVSLSEHKKWVLCATLDSGQ